MRICITGAAGGIGSAVSDALFKQGHTLLLIDDLSSGDKKNFKVLENANNLIVKTVTDSIRVIEDFKDCKFIINFAAVTSLAECQINPLKAFNINTLEVVKLIDVALKEDITFIQASTSAIYENNFKAPFSEDEVTTPTLVYPLSKKFVEDYLISAGKTYDLNYYILRFFNVFSPNQNLQRTKPPLINYIIREIAMNRVPRIHAPLNQKRDYVCVEDIVELISKIISLPSGSPQKLLLNVCRAEAISISEIIKSIELGVNKPIEIELGQPDQLWEEYESRLSRKKVFDKAIITKETLKISVGDSTESISSLGWSARHNVLDCIRQEAKNIYDRAQKFEKGDL